MASTIKNSYVSIRLIGDRLLSRGYTVEDIELDDVYRLFMAPNGRTWLTKRALVSYPFISLAAAQIGRNKQLSYQFATLHGAITPYTLRLPRQRAQADAFLLKHQPLVVKPLSSFSSHGLTLNIATKPQLDAAIAKAAQYDNQMLVQKQFKGNEVRFMVIEGEVVACLQRENARVIGDGASTVQQLIEADNIDRANLNFEIVPYPQLDATMIDERFFSDQRVPAAGEAVELNATSLVNEGGSMRDVTADVHQSYKALALQLGTALNPSFVGIDMLIVDHTKPLNPDNYVFLEFTFAPSLRLFYDVRSGQDYDMAGRLADMIDDYCGVKTTRDLPE